MTNAFLSGMQEDLGMFGNQLVTATSIWTVGYVIGQIPSNLLLTRVSPRYVIPTASAATNHRLTSSVRTWMGHRDTRVIHRQEVGRQ